MISMDKKYRTRDGRDVRLLCVDADGMYTVVGFAGGCLQEWSCDGLSNPMKSGCSPLDLIEFVEPEVRTIFINVYETFVKPYGGENHAKMNAGVYGNCIATAVPVTFEFTRDQK